LVWWLQNHQAAPQKAQSGALKPSINTALASAPVGANPPNFRGAANSPIVLEEFADYQCPTCAKVHPVLSQIASEYGSRIKFVYRSFPLTSIHDKWSSSMDHRTLFADYAKLIGLDVEKFKTDSAGLLTKSRVDADLARASAARLNGTPSLFLNGSPIDVAQITVDRLRQIIEEELKRFQATQSQGSAPQK
jgi:protein-disulfide isomerase